MGHYKTHRTLYDLDGQPRLAPHDVYKDTRDAASRWGRLAIYHMTGTGEWSPRFAAECAKTAAHFGLAIVGRDHARTV